MAVPVTSIDFTVGAPSAFAAASSVWAVTATGTSRTTAAINAMSVCMGVSPPWLDDVTVAQIAARGAFLFVACLRECDPVGQERRAPLVLVELRVGLAEDGRLDRTVRGTERPETVLLLH